MPSSQLAYAHELQGVDLAHGVPRAVATCSLRPLRPFLHCELDAARSAAFDASLQRRHRHWIRFPHDPLYQLTLLMMKVAVNYRGHLQLHVKEESDEDNVLWSMYI